MELFDEMPYLENDKLILREMTIEDTPCLKRITEDPKVYTYLPTFLYEQKYKDPEEVIRRMREECFETKDSILLGIFRKESPGEMVGIAEIYAWDKDKNKASIGYRLARDYWHCGIAEQVLLILKDYLENIIGIRTITGHIMRHNIASAKIVEKHGFENKYPGLWEDWGREGPVLTDKYIYKNLNNPKNS